MVILALSSWVDREATDKLGHTRPRSIYQYSNMAPRLSGQNCKVSFASQFPKETWIQRKHRQIYKFVLKASEPC